MAKILIAEDDKSMCQFLALALERAGHSVIGAHDGLEALALLERYPDTELLLTDIVMPGMDGIELAQTALRRNPALKTMFITGFSAMVASAGRELPQTGRVVPKPFHLKDLLDQIDKLLAAA